MASAAATTAKVEAPEKTLGTPQSTEAAKTSEDNLPVTATKSATEAPPSSPGAAGKTEADGGAPVTDTLKKMKRAERFNVPVLLSEQEKRSSRAERFGTGTGTGSQGSEALKKSEDLKKRARAERFGITPATASTDDDAKKKARLARFTPAASKLDSEEEEKRKARALRFSQSASSTKDSSNGKGNTETKAAVLSTAGDGQ